MLNLGDIYKRVEDKWVSRFIMDEVVIMPLCRSEEDMQYIYSISNETGSKVWQLLDGGHSVRDIQEILKREYQGQGEVIEREVLEFVRDLFEVGLIVKAEETRDEGQGTDEKKIYKSPEIFKIKMQPEQAVLACCTSTYNLKQIPENANRCATSAGTCQYCPDYVSQTLKGNTLNT